MTTVTKQLIFGSKDGMSLEERKSYKPIIYKTLLQIVAEMVKAAPELRIEHDQVLSSSLNYPLIHYRKLQIE